MIRSLIFSVATATAFALLPSSASAASSAALEKEQMTCPLERVQSLSTAMGRQAGRVRGIGRRLRRGESDDQLIDQPPAPMQSYVNVERIRADRAKQSLDRIMDKLMAAAGDRAPATRPAITLSADPVYRGDVFFDEKMVISHELFRMADGDDEIAFILAHELAHIINGDTRNAASMNRSLERVQAMQRGIEFAADLASLKAEPAQQQGLTPIEETEIEEHNRKIRELTDRFVLLSQKVVTPIWKAEQEDAADLLAAELMLKAGYSIVGADLAMEHMRESKLEVCQVLETFRKSVDEYSSVAQSFDWNTVLEGGDYISIGASFAQINKRAEKKFRDALIAAALPSTHRPYDERVERIRGWLNDEANEDYLFMSEDNARVIRELNGYRGTPAFNRTQGSIDAAIEVNAFLDKGDLVSADQKMRLVDTSSSHGRILKRRLRNEQGKPADAAENLRLALVSASVEPALIVYTMRAEDLLTSGEVGSIDALAGLAARQFNDDAYFLPDRINAAAKLGATETVTTLLEECQSHQRAQLIKTCFAATVAERQDYRKATEELYKLAGCDGNSCSTKRVGNWLNKKTKQLGSGLVDAIKQ
ncbi:M48 family metalloprotease [Parvularcula sp. ZS-1/3]|uniref:M48 family metalloprotease n=1 Tax=Parvularcula mediterranea TaxID=2732508 RepID=A0A7Y3RJZ5_9PROT|nr:M48 family metalloprotease [Parvularcula mediterranea]NNU14772.1 M48 family metalloprotease [Parvularcula mediterranea]